MRSIRLVTLPFLNPALLAETDGDLICRVTKIRGQMIRDFPVDNWTNNKKRISDLSKTSTCAGAIWASARPSHIVELWLKGGTGSPGHGSVTDNKQNLKL